MTFRRAAVAIVVALVAVASHGCGETVLVVFDRPATEGGDGGSGDGSSDALSEAGPCGDRKALDVTCATSAECCSGYCAVDARLETTCRPTTGCVGAGGSCDRAGACCSLSCNAGACAAGGTCKPVGTACGSPLECCTNVCNAGQCRTAGPGCSPAGETCLDDSDCCGRSCLVDGDFLRCALLQACRVEGETCSAAADCCTGRCADSGGVLRCAKLSSCTMNDTKGCGEQVGDVCKDANSCCSRLCVATGDGVKRCASLGGCRPQCDLCASNGDCCSGVCAPDATGASRCQPAACGAIGEVCERDDGCCAGSKCATEPGHGGPRRCQPPPEQPCVGEARCAMSSQCCAGECSAGSSGPECVPSCRQVGAACAARADCCGPSVDCLAIGGRRVCAPLVR